MAVALATSLRSPSTASQSRAPKSSSNKQSRVEKKQAVSSWTASFGMFYHLAEKITSGKSRAKVGPAAVAPPTRKDGYVLP
ncbi:hypothetical protein HKX48_005538, partial [Thoreauomyces humboldtii]